MGIFGNSSPFDVEVEKATNEKNTSEDWATIMEICDSVGNSSQKSKDCLRSIVKRLNHEDPHIVVQAITLLDACSSNCGKNFHLEIASREFENELRKLLMRSQPKLVDKVKALIKKWAEGDFKTDAQLNLIPSLYSKLKQDGIDFTNCIEPQKHSCTNYAATSKEEADLAKAIELSLKDNKSQNSSPITNSLYPSVNAPLNYEKRKVRALYDFEAAEDNELSFAAGDIIHIIDDSDANWWKGQKGKMEGLFPSNFVTADLSVEPDHISKLEQGGKKVQFVEEVEVKTLKREPEVIEVQIDEMKIDRMLQLLHGSDPERDTTDPAELVELEEQVMAMGPLIDAALERVDRRHAQLTQLSSDLVDALNLYHTLQREPPPPTPSAYTYQKIPQHMNPMYNYPYNNMHHQFPGNFNPNVSAVPDYLPPTMTSMAMPHHYHMHPGVPQGHQPAGVMPGHPGQMTHPGMPQGITPGANLTHQQEPSSLPYPAQGFPPQGGVPQTQQIQYAPAPPPSATQGPSQAQQPQYPSPTAGAGTAAAPNGQHMM